LADSSANLGAEAQENVMATQIVPTVKTEPLVTVLYALRKDIVAVWPLNIAFTPSLAGFLGEMACF